MRSLSLSRLLARLTRKPTRPIRRAQPKVETLEDRCVPSATYDNLIQGYGNNVTEYYKLNDASGPTMTDSGLPQGGFFGNGTYSNSGITYSVPGPVASGDNAITLDGFSGSAQINTATFADPFGYPTAGGNYTNQQFSFSAWFKTSPGTWNSNVNGWSYPLQGLGNPLSWASGVASSAGSVATAQWNAPDAASGLTTGSLHDTYTFGPANANDVVQMNGQNVYIPATQQGNYAFLNFLGWNQTSNTGTGLTLTIHYTDGGVQTINFGMANYVTNNGGNWQQSASVTNGSKTIGVSGNNGLYVGIQAYGNGLPAGTTVTSISGNTITLSNPYTGPSGFETISFLNTYGPSSNFLGETVVGFGPTMYIGYQAGTGYWQQARMSGYSFELNNPMGPDNVAYITLPNNGSLYLAALNLDTTTTSTSIDLTKAGNAAGTASAYTNIGIFNAHTAYTGGEILGQTSAYDTQGNLTYVGDLNAAAFIPALYVDGNGYLRSNFFHGPADNFRGITSPFAVDDGKWHLATVTFSNTTETLYIDGQPVGTTQHPQSSYTVKTAAGVTKTGYSYFLGAGLNNWNNSTSAAGSWDYFKGSLAQAAMFATALTPQQVQAQYEAGTQADNYLQVTLTNPGPVLPGANTTYTLTVTNTEGSQALAKASESSNTVTLTTANATTIKAGDTVYVTGVPIAGYNGTFTVLSATGNTFTYTDGTTGLATTTGGGLVYDRTAVLPLTGGVSDTFPSGIVSDSWTATAAGGATGFSATGSGALADAALSMPAGSSVTYIINALVSPNQATNNNWSYYYYQGWSPFPTPGTLTDSATTTVSGGTTTTMAVTNSVATPTTQVAYNNGSQSAYTFGQSWGGWTNYANDLVMDFNVNSTPVQVTQLGAFDGYNVGFSSGTTITVGIYSSGNLSAPIASTTFTHTNPGIQIDSNTFKPIAPVVLTNSGYYTAGGVFIAGSGHYLIVAKGYNNTDQAGDNNGPWWTTDGDSSLLTFTGTGYFGPTLTSLQSNGGPPNPFAAGTFMYQPYLASNLAISQTAPASVAQGGTATYTFTVTNNGNIFAPQVSIYDPIPASQYQSYTWTATATAGSSVFQASGSGTGGTPLSTFVTLAPGGSATFTVNALVLASGAPNPVGNTVTAAAADMMPTNLQVVPSAASNILTWNAANGATSYNIYRGTSPGGEGAAPIANVAATSGCMYTNYINNTTGTYYLNSPGGATITRSLNYGYTDVNAAAGTTYYYFVKAVYPNLKAPSTVTSYTSPASNEASGTPTTFTSGAVPATPTLGSTAGGTLAAATYYVQVTYLYAAGGESVPSAEASLAVAANNVLSVTSPAAAAGAIAYNVYVGTATGGEVLQNASPIPLGTNWNEPTTGLVAGKYLHGVYAKFYNNVALNTVADQTTEGGVNINNFYGSYQNSNPNALNYLSPKLTGGGNNFSIEYSGYIQPTTTGWYGIGTVSDDGSQLFLNGIPISQNYVYQGATRRYNTVYLVAGQFYPFVMDYYQGGGGYQANLQWYTNNGGWVNIPTANLYAVNLSRPQLTPPAGDPIQDANFSNPNVGVTGRSNNPIGTPWTYTNGSNSNEGVTSNLDGYWQQGTQPSPTGNQAAFIQGDGSISQVVNFTQGGTYAISFLAAQRGPGGNGEQTFEILVDGADVGIIKPAGDGNFHTYYTSYFTVAAGNHTITFKGVRPNNPYGDHTGFFTDVALVTQTPPPVGFQPQAVQATSVVAISFPPTTLSVIKTESGSPQAGGKVTYFVTVTNTGTNTAYNVHLFDPLPKYESLFSDTRSFGSLQWVQTYNAATNTVDDSIASLGPNGTATFAWVVQLATNTPAGNLTNTVIASADNAGTAIDSGSATQVGNFVPDTDVTGGSLYNSTLTITGASESGATAKLTFTGTNSFQVGQQVQVTGLAVPQYNGTFTVTAVTAGSISYTAPVSGLATLGAGGSAAHIVNLAGNLTAYRNTTGTVYATTTPISSNPSPAPDGVYHTERTGTTLTYTIPGFTPNGTYNVRLDFAEMQPQGSGGGDGQFDVTINGTKVLTKFDIGAAANAGALFKANDQSFTAQADGSGNIKIVLDGSPYGSFAEISGIQISAASSQTMVVTTSAQLVVTKQAAAYAALGLASESSNTVTIATRGYNPLAVGNTVIVTGVPISGYNGTFTVTAVTANSFSYTDSTTGLATTSGGVAYTAVGTVGSGATVGTGSNVDPGNLLGYFITITNNGPADAKNVTLSDNLATGVTEFADSGPIGYTTGWTSSDTPNSFSGTFAALPSGKSATFIWTVAVGTNTANPVPNTVTVNSTTPLAGGSINTATVNTALNNPASNLVVTKTANVSSITPGGQITYTVTVANNGNDNATNVALTDPLPSGTWGNVTVVSDTQTSGLPWTMSDTGNQFLRSIANLGAGKSASFTWVVQVPNTAPEGLILNNIVTATATNRASATNFVTRIDAGYTGSAPPSPFVADTDFSGTSSTLTTAATITTTGLTDPSPAPMQVFQTERYGTSFTYTIPGLTATKVYGVRLDFAELQPYGAGVGDGIFNVAINGTTVLTNFDIGAAAKGTDIALDQLFTATANASGQIVITFTGTGTGSQNFAEVSGVEISTAATAVNYPPAAITVTKVQTSPAPPTGITAGSGTNLTYTITVTDPTTNPKTGNPNNPAYNVVVKDVLPTGTWGNILFQSDTFPGGGNWTESDPGAGNNGTVTFTLKPGVPLAVGASATFTITVSVPAGVDAAKLTPAGTLTNTATATAGNLATQGNTLTASATTPITNTASVAVNKTATSGNVTAGNNVTYNLTLTTTGPSDAFNVTLTDPLPKNFQVVSLNVPNTGWFGTTNTTGGGITTVTFAPTAGNVNRAVAPGTLSGFQIVAKVPASMVANTYNNVATVAWNDGTPSSATSGNVPVVVKDSATLNVTKTATTPNPPGPGNVWAGQQITYNLSLTTGGPSDAFNVQLSDPLPTGTTLVSVTTPAGWTRTDTTPVGSNGIVTFAPTSNVPLAPGSNVSGFVIVVGTPPSMAPQTVTNTATLTASDASQATSTVNTTLTDNATLTISKIGTPLQAPGKNVTYTITLTNTGPSNASGVSITDVLDPNLWFISDTNNGWTVTHPAVGANGTVTFTDPNPMAPGSLTFTLVAEIIPTTVNGTTINNTATANWNDPNGSSVTSSPVTTTMVQTVPVLNVTKTGPANVYAGTNGLTYTLNINNTGGSATANGVSLTDVLPSPETFVSINGSGGTGGNVTTAGGVTWSYSFNTGTNTLTLNDLDPTGMPISGVGSSANFTLVVGVPSSTPSGTVLTNQATGSATNGAPYTSTAVNTTVNNQANLVVTKAASLTTMNNPGQNLTYTITVQDTGLSDAQGVTLTDPLPAGTTFVSVGALPPGWTEIDPGVGNNGIVTFTDGNPLTAGAAAVTFTITVFVPSTTPNGTVLSNTVTAATTTPTKPGDVLTANAKTTVNNQANLTVTKTASLTSGGASTTTVSAGKDLFYTITVQNGGPTDAQGVVLSDLLPAGTTFVAITSTLPTGWSEIDPGVGNNGTVKFTDANPLTAGASAVSFTIEVLVGAALPDKTILTNKATATSTTPVTGTTSATVQTTVTNEADLVVTKTASPSPSVAPGSPITYTIGIQNTGPNNAQNVTLTDPLPHGASWGNITFKSLNGSTATTGNINLGAGNVWSYKVTSASGIQTVTLTDTNPLGAPGSGLPTSATFTLIVNTPGSTPGNNSVNVTNTVTAATTTATVPGDVLSASANTTLTFTPILKLTKSDGNVTTVTPTTASPNPIITYKLALTNTGSVAATMTNVADQLPANTVLVSASGPAGWTETGPAVGSNGLVAFSNPSFGITGNNPVYFTITVQVSTGLFVGGTISNTAQVGASNLPAPGYVNSNTVTVNVALNPYAQYVANVYHILLNRAPDPAGGTAWVNALQAGLPTASFVAAIEQSPEYLSDVVNGIYQHYLGRPADPAGLAGWVSQLEAGVTIEQVTAAIITSQEYLNDKGGTNAGFITGLYKDVLGRSPTAAELNNWLSYISLQLVRNGGGGVINATLRNQIALGFLTSGEYYSDLVNNLYPASGWAPYGPNWEGYYQEFLGRNADPAGLAAWVNALLAGATDQNVVAAILGSGEAFAHLS